MRLGLTHLYHILRVVNELGILRKIVNMFSKAISDTFPQSDDETFFVPWGEKHTNYGQR